MKSRYVIFADDDADDRELITGFFKQYNTEVTVLEFKDGKEVVSFLEEFAVHNNTPVLIVLDLNMHRMNGKETLARIRKIPTLQYVPVIIYTTTVSKENERYFEQHMASWIHKPYHVDEVNTIAAIIAEFCRNNA